MTVLVTIKTVV